MEIIFFNRVAKSGSETMMDLMDKLGKVNEFLVARNRPKKAQNLVLQEQKQEDLASTISSLEKPVVYVEHVNYINFTEFNLPRPIYINLVRDPVERVISWFNYVRGSWYNVLRHKRFPDLPMKEKDWYNKDFNSCVRNNDPECRYEFNAVNDSFGDHRRQSLFFCGHSADCLPFNSPTAIQKAKYIVEKEYAVVGSWEDTNITLAVLEHYIPRFFQGATSLYYLFAEELRNKNRSQYKPYVADDIKDMIRKNFTNEIDFYRFCKQRLYKQFIAIKLEQNKRHLKK